MKKSVVTEIKQTTASSLFCGLNTGSIAQAYTKKIQLINITKFVKRTPRTPSSFDFLLFITTFVLIRVSDINKSMSKFDMVFEKLRRSIQEKEYIGNTFEDNVRTMVRYLQDTDYLPKETKTEDLVANLLKQTGHVKTLILDTNDGSIPPIKIQMKQIGSTQEPDTEDFSVTVIPVKDPAKQKEFANSMLETIFDEVVDYVKQLSLKGLSPESAVEELPQEENPANVQAGAEDSALPGVQQPPQQ
jgi:hypothetical protein